VIIENSRFDVVYVVKMLTVQTDKTAKKLQMSQLKYFFSDHGYRQIIDYCKT